ncbi:putative membrane protein [Stackebrandtia endophytica]|uniref:Putative membrane protein n=1 Tax=Stackebrandtia endophytica TaxID=1496996 RepID=A0A543AQJ4_9ACTN|nr:PH domain-containing protein [Stackebrandtia endophytica]TQL74848.1 putative membrane protein [Stackebrandtia endophytica]
MTNPTEPDPSVESAHTDTEPAGDVEPTPEGTDSAGIELLDQGRQRLHPFSPVLHGIKTLWLVIAALSWQGLARFGLTIGGALILAGGILGMIWATLTWYYTGYQVQDGQLRIIKGVLVRRHRTIPLDRLQSIELRQPLLARFVGLAELRLEVVGGSSSEAPLAFLPLEEAEQLRVRLLALSKRLGADVTVPAMPGIESTDNDRQPAAAEVADEPGERLVTVVPTKRLVTSQLLTPEVFFVPVAMVATVGFFLWQPDMSFYGLAGLITATIGIMLRPIGQAMSNYDFTLHETPDGLRVRRGLTERRTQTLPLARVTAAVIRWPLLWRKPRWVHARVANAGHSGQRVEELAQGSTVLPVGRFADARAITTMALSGIDMTEAELAPVPRRAVWCAPIGRPALGAAITPRLFITRSGRLSPQLVGIPRQRIQSVRVVQSRLQRLLRLATVHVDIAGGLGVPAHAAHRDVTEALRMARELGEKISAPDPTPPATETVDEDHDRG